MNLTMKFRIWSSIDNIVHVIAVLATVILWVANLTGFLDYEVFWAPITWIYFFFGISAWQVFSSFIYLYQSEAWRDRWLYLLKPVFNLLPLPVSLPFWLISTEILAFSLMGVTIAMLSTLVHVGLMITNLRSEEPLFSYDAVSGDLYQY